MGTLRFFVKSIFIVFFLGKLHAYQLDNNPYRHIETLDKDGKYQLEWLVDWEKSRVIFNVTVKTKGYVGLGLTRKGKMSGADIVIGGVLSNGRLYFSDRHAVANQLPVEDLSQDWTLHSASESDTHTFLSFSRPFDTCDENHDLPIHDDVIGLIWAFGEKDDDIQYHHQNRGVFYTYLLDPDLTPRELEKTEKQGFGEGSSQLGDWKVWSIPHTFTVPVKDTAYICTIHKAPTNQKSHIVGFRSILPTEAERRHIHHYLLHRCIPPPGQTASRVFQHLLEDQQECYVMSDPVGRIPTQYCTEVVHVWAVGQKPNFFPDHVGLPVYPDEYYMLQVHYDNHNLIPGVQVNHALEIFYTEQLRQHDGGALLYGQLTPGAPSIMVPPNSIEHVIYGHCGSACTKSMLPSSGIRVFASFLHSHLAGRGLRVLHIRDNKELPWISYDDNYNFDYQQIRTLREERLILPGDTIIKRCVFENADGTGNVTIGGFSTRQEMCSGLLWYYNRLPDRAWCHSEIRSEKYREFLQIDNTTWSNYRIENVVTSPPQNEGLLVSEVGSYRTDWTIAKREQLQEYHRSLPQITICPSTVVHEEGNENALARGNSRLSSPRPPLLPQRYSLRQIVKRVSTTIATPVNVRKSTVRSTHPEIQKPDIEFVTVYPKDIEPYQRPSVCSSAKKSPTTT